MPKPPKPDEQLRNQADLVIQEFGRLEEYEFAWPTDAQAEVTIEKLGPKKDLLTRLDSALLPQLQQQCASLSETLHSLSRLHEDPAQKLKLVSEIQTNLHQTLRQTIQTLNEIFPGRIPEPYPTNDQRFNEFKIYRLQCLGTTIREHLDGHLKKFFQQSATIIEDFKDCKLRPYIALQLRWEMDDIDENIDASIGFSKKSELNLIWDVLEEKSVRFDQVLTRISIHISPLRLFCFGVPRLSQPTIELGASLIPIIKLSRTFFRKLHQQRIKKKEIEMFTEMCSHQLFLLDHLIERILDSLAKLSQSVDTADIFDQDDTAATIVEELQKLIEFFHSYLCLINLYILPNLFPPLLDFSSQVYFQSWYVAWTTSFLTATHNATQAAESFCDT
ncbi:hypothetical protein PGT21_018301 [Puccinia graminis f. sp. tritici]|uniref:Uncharacterized protein n=1 Tax=Puccinia graminis f. sp. tritici TaxID=56615 RepID=A0A5B0RQ24_PUCGR|nr:hypothetical protein PGT21_018301 [Puccinia graminis f. sp. tritici]KAA1126933.1 hypothetical protein PGTUg99_032747 [Puccinia graminis f. sp. tritici]